MPRDREDRRRGISHYPHCLRLVPRVSAPWQLWVMPAAHPGNLSRRWREPQCREAERLRLLKCEADSVLGTVYSCRKTQVGRGDIEKGIDSVCHTPSWLKLVLSAFLSLTTKGVPIMPLTSVLPPEAATPTSGQPGVQGIALSLTCMTPLATEGARKAKGLWQNLCADCRARSQEWLIVVFCPWSDATYCLLKYSEHVRVAKQLGKWEGAHYGLFSSEK